jgi:spermidine synthase
MQKNETTSRYVYYSIFLISCSMLMFEVLLTRVCALRLFFHFAFLVVSNCLLGIGASGSMIFVMQKTFARKERYWVWLFSVLYVLSLVLTYIFLLSYSIEQGIDFNSMGSMLSFTVFNLTAAVPFFFGGSVIGLLLTFNANQVNKVYGWDLLGAGLGCLLCPFFLWKTGAGGCLVFVALLALVGAVVSSPAKYRKVSFTAGIALGIIGLSFLPILDRQFPVPSKNEVFITGKIGIEFQKNISYSRWSATSRVDLVNLDPDHYYILGHGGKEDRSVPVPEEKWIMQDGSAGTYIVNFSENPWGLKKLKGTLYSAAFILKDQPRVFIIGVGGGNDVWAAKVNGASFIKGIELNAQILDIHRKKLARFSRGITEAPGIQLIFDEGRSALMRDDSTYDVIQMSGIDTWTSLTSGAYVLAENYLYTTEALRVMYDRLTDGGIIAITRFAATMETTRLFSNIFAAFEDRAVSDLENSLVCLGHGILRTILVKKGEFTAAELERLDAFSDQWGFEYAYRPGRVLDNVVEKFIHAENKHDFIRDFPRDISPTTDDQPYFFNFYKWSRLFSTAKQVHETSAVSQGNPFLIFIQFLISTVLALAFILLPIVIFMRKELDRTYLTRFLIYFAGLGIGFIAIEITLIQKLVLFLGHPLYSITVTLFSMLIFAGLGSMISHRWFRSPTPLTWIVLAVLVVLLGLFIMFSPAMVESWITWPTAARILVCAAMLAPIGLLLGIPFAYGIRLVNRYNPTIVPWAWAVNGSMTVIGSILSVILSMNLGFNAVMITALVVYFFAFLAIRKLSTA